LKILIFYITNRYKYNAKGEKENQKIEENDKKATKSLYCFSACPPSCERTKKGPPVRNLTGGP
jgi:hypothetical protein